MRAGGWWVGVAIVAACALARAQDAPLPDQGASDDAAAEGVAPAGEQSVAPPGAEPPVVLAGPTPVAPPAPVRQARERHEPVARPSAPPTWTSRLGFLGSVRFVVRGEPILGVAVTDSGRELPSEKAVATPFFLLGVHYRRLTVALAVHYYSFDGEDAGLFARFTFTGFGPTVMLRVAEASGERVQLHVFGSFLYGVAKIRVSGGEDFGLPSGTSRAHSYGGTLGVLGRGFLLPMLGLDAGIALDMLDFEESDSTDGATQIQLVGFLGLTFAS